MHKRQVLLRWWGTVGWSCLLGLLFAASSVQGQGSELSEEEKRALAAGQLVTRPEEKRTARARWLGGTSYQVIDAPPAVVWAALLDTPRYPRMLPVVESAELVDSGPSARKLHVEQGRGFVHVRYFLDLQIDPVAQEIGFRIDPTRPHDLRAAWGLYSVRPYGGERTLLVYGIMADIGDGLLRSLVRDTVHEWMLKVPWTIKRFLEGSGRDLYSDAATDAAPAPSEAEPDPSPGMPTTRGTPALSAAP